MTAQKNRKPSLKDIAAEAGVSSAAVSYVLNGKHKMNRISDDLADRIREIARAMDYKPNGFARSLKTGTGKTIGVILADISNSFSARLAKVIEASAEKAGYMAIFSSSDEYADNFAALADKLLAKEVVGIIMIPCDGADGTVKTLLNRGVPLVLLDRFIPGLDTDYVCIDNKGAAAALTDGLIAEGRRKVGMISYDMDVSNMLEREAGYLEAIRKAGCMEGEVIRIDFHDMERCCNEGVDALLDAGCDAIMFATYTLAVHCLRHIGRKGLHIPKDLAIASFDGGPIFEFLYAPITYYYQPLEELGSRAVELLIDRVEHGREDLCMLRLKGQLAVNEYFRQ